MVERFPVKEWVVGSNPTCGAKSCNHERLPRNERLPVNAVDPEFIEGLHKAASKSNFG